MKKKLAILLGLFLFLMPLFSVSSSDNKEYSVKKIAYLEEKLFVLSPKERVINQHDLSGKQVSSFDLKPSLEAIDFVAFQDRLLIIFSGLPFLFVYNSSGAFIQQIPISASIQKPSAMHVAGDYLLIDRKSVV